MSTTMTNTEGFHPRFSRPFEVTLAEPATGAFFDTLEASWENAKTKKMPLNVTSDKLAALLTTTRDLTQDSRKVAKGTIMAGTPSALRPIGSSVSNAASGWKHYVDLAENGETHLSRISKVIKSLNGIPEPTDADNMKAATEIYEELSLFHEWIESCKDECRNEDKESHPLYRSASLKLEQGFLRSFDSDLTRPQASMLNDWLPARLEEVVTHCHEMSQAESADIKSKAKDVAKFAAGALAGASVVLQFAKEKPA